MFRLAAVFTAVWMLLVGSAVAAVFYFFVEWSEMELAAAGLAALVALMLYTTLAARLHDRNEISDQIADLSRLNADLAKQMAEIKHSLAAAESKLAGAVNCVHAVAEPVTTQIGELSVVVKQLAETVAAHEAALAARIDPDADATGEAAFWRCAGRRAGCGGCGGRQLQVTRHRRHRHLHPRGDRWRPHRSLPAADRDAAAAQGALSTRP